MARFPLLTVDVFTERPLLGNPVAVVLEADALDPATMQRVAAWTNLSETTFVLRPPDGADWRVRIFTPRLELPFAGHPTLGTAHAVLAHGGVPPGPRALRQACAAGVLPVERDAGGRLWVRVPPARVADAGAAVAGALAAALGVPAREPRVVDVGAVWLVARLADDAAVRGLRPDLAAVAAVAAEAGATAGVTVFAAGDPLVVRSFAPGAGVPEDPVCGSGNAAVAGWRVAGGEVAGPAAWTASQGREVGRDGRVAVRVDADGGVWVGGHAVTVAAGELRL